MRPVLKLKERVDILENFLESINEYTKWWGNMEVDHKTLESRSEVLSKTFNGMRSRSVLDMWITFRSDYKEYILQVRGTQLYSLRTYSD